MKPRDAPPSRRRKVRPEKPRTGPRDIASPRRRGKARPSLRDRLPRGRRRGKSVPRKLLGGRRLGPRPEKSREVISLRKNDIAPARKFREREPINDLRPVRNYEPAPFENSYRSNSLSQRKVPEKSDLLFLDYMHEVSEKYRTVHHDDLLLKKESRSERRDLRYQDNPPPRRNVREKQDKYPRPESPSRKYVDEEKYERRFRENLSPHRKNSTFESFSKFDGLSFPSNSRAEKYDKYSSHENHSSSRRSDYPERSRKHDDDLFPSKNSAPLPKHRDRYPDRLSPLLDRNFLMKEPSPPRRPTSDKYDRRKDYSVSRLPSLMDKIPRLDIPSPKRYDKYNNDSYPRRRDIPEERPSRNHTSSPRRKYADNPPSRSFPDRPDKYSHNNLSPHRRNTHNEKYDLPPPPPPAPRRSEPDRPRRPREPIHSERRERPPSPRRNSRPEKRPEKYSNDFLPPREPPPHSDKRSNKYYDHAGEPRSDKPPLFSRKSTQQRFDKLEVSKKYPPPPPRLDKRDRHLTEMAHSGKDESRIPLKRALRPERLPEQYSRRE